MAPESKPHSDPFEEIREIGRVLEAMWPDDHRSASYVKALSDKLQRLEEQHQAALGFASGLHVRLKQVERERDAVGENADSTLEFYEAAEQRVAELEEALREIAEGADPWCENHCGDIARAALQPKEEA